MILLITLHTLQSPVASGAGTVSAGVDDGGRSVDLRRDGLIGRTVLLEIDATSVAANRPEVGTGQCGVA